LRRSILADENDRKSRRGAARGDTLGDSCSDAGPQSFRDRFAVDDARHHIRIER